MGACGWLGERTAVLALVIILVIAAVFVYIVRAVKPKRVKVHARVLKIIDMGFEADSGDQSREADAGLGRGGDLKEFPPTETDRQ